MLNTQHLLKVSAAWISIVYAVCYFGVLFFPGLRFGFPRWALHTTTVMGENISTLGTFVSGLIIWNVIVLAAVWLFAVLFNSIKK